MTTTPILGMTDLVSGQSVPEASVNEHDRILEWFAAGGAIEDRDQTDPTAITPSDGQAWLIAASATGVWSGKDGKLALYVNTGWIYFTAKEGMRIWVKDEDMKSIFNGAAWADESSGGGSGGYNPQSASYTLVLSDAGKLVSVANAGANTLTIPPNADVAFPINTRVDIGQYGAGQTTITAGSGVTIRSAGGALKLNSQYSGATLQKIGTNEWWAFGDLTT